MPEPLFDDPRMADPRWVKEWVTGYHEGVCKATHIWLEANFGPLGEELVQALEAVSTCTLFGLVTHPLATLADLRLRLGLH